jgi:hypothetical protein
MAELITLEGDIARLPVEEYLKRQGRFTHLFQPQRNETLLNEIQAESTVIGEG